MACRMEPGQAGAARDAFLGLDAVREGEGRGGLRGALSILFVVWLAGLSIVDGAVYTHIDDVL
jgi:hypothetical protein